jgi:surfeit locus 1 family protein
MARGRGKFVFWMASASVLFAGFVLLGNWQVRRYHLKLGISHAMQTRVHAAPVPAPGPREWPRSGQSQYLHVSLGGHYLPGAQTLVRGTSRDGYGFWVMTPLQTERGFIVLVNRGYIPDSLPQQPAFAGTNPPIGAVTLTGLLRASEPGGGFLRSNQPQKNLWYSRDVAAIAAAHDLPPGNVAPYFVDADAVPGNARWPAAGLTQVHIYNHSLGYAITWYLLALGTLLCAGIVIYHERALARE